MELQPRCLRLLLTLSFLLCLIFSTHPFSLEYFFWIGKSLMLFWSLSILILPLYNPVTNPFLYFHLLVKSLRSTCLIGFIHFVLTMISYLIASLDSDQVNQLNLLPLNSNSSICCTFFDLTKAFNSLPHQPVSISIVSRFKAIWLIVATNFV